MDTAGTTALTAEEIAAALAAAVRLPDNTEEMKAIKKAAVAALSAQVIPAFSVLSASSDPATLITAAAMVGDLRGHMSKTGQLDPELLTINILDICKNNPAIDQGLTVRVHFQTGILLRDRSRPEEALANFEAAARLFPDAGPAAFGGEKEKTLRGVEIHHRIGTAYMDLGRLQEAEKSFLEVANAQVGATEHAPYHAMVDLAIIHQHRGNLGEAEKWFKKADAGYKSLPDGRKFPTGEGNCAFFLGESAVSRGDADTAATLFESAKQHYTTARSTAGIGHYHRGMGDVALLRNDPNAAKEQYQQAIGRYEAAKNPLNVGLGTLGLGRVAQHEGDKDQAIALYKQALPLVSSQPYYTALVHVALAGVTEGQERARHQADAVIAFQKAGVPERAAQIGRDGTGELSVPGSAGSRPPLGATR